MALVRIDCHLPQFCYTRPSRQQRISGAGPAASHAPEVAPRAARRLGSAKEHCPGGQLINCAIGARASPGRVKPRERRWPNLTTGQCECEGVRSPGRAEPGLGLGDVEPNRPLADPQTRGDDLVGTPQRDQTQHAALLSSEYMRGLSALKASHERLVRRHRPGH